MADLGLQNALGGEAMAQQVRQRILDQLQQQYATHQMSVEDQKLEIERQKVAQEVANQTQQRQIQNQAAATGEAAKLAPQLPMDQNVSPQGVGILQAGGIGGNLYTPPTQGETVSGKPLDTTTPNAANPFVNLGTPGQQENQRRMVLRGNLLKTPGLSPRDLVNLQAEDAGLKALPNEPAVKAPEPVVRTNAATGRVERLVNGAWVPQAGDVPAGSHFMSEPTPPAPANSYQLQPEIDPTTGKQTGRFFSFNTKTNQWEIPQGAGPNATKGGPATSQTKDEDRQRALLSLDQVDKAIDQAKDLIGPGEGRISSIEQTVGNPDPRINALGTKLLIAKMQVDAGIGGARAAASPQLLARWDNLLTQKLTPEALHASVQALREILSEGQKPNVGNATPKLSAEELIKKYGR